MTDSARYVPPALRRRIEDHLEKVDAALQRRATSEAERRHIVEELRAQIDEMLFASGRQEPSVADVEAVLAQLDPPEAYGANDAGGSSRPSGESQSPPLDARLSRSAVLGFLWSPLFFLVGVLAFARPAFNVIPGMPPPSPTPWEYFLRFTLLPLGLAATFGTTLLGIGAILEICRSRGRVYGLALAVFDALLFPLLLLDAAIAVVCTIVFGAMADAEWMSVKPSVTWRLLAIIVLSIVLDFLIARYAWRRVRTYCLAPVST